MKSHCKCLYSFTEKYLGVVKTTPRGRSADAHFSTVTKNDPDASVRSYQISSDRQKHTFTKKNMQINIEHANRNIKG